MMNTETVKRFPEIPNLNPPQNLVECDPCLGWGIILGTDTPDFWGEPCTCGRPYLRPVGVIESQALHSAHMQARLYAEVLA